MERVTSLPRGGLLQAARPALAGARLEAVPGFDRSVVDRARRIGGQLETGRVDAGRVLCRPRRLELSGSGPATVDGRIMEIVIGVDDRVPAPDPIAYPWRCVCALDIVAGDGTSWVGTGCLVGPRLVMTAGHVVYMHDHGGWAREVRVAPGRSIDAIPFGEAVATRFHSVSGWTAQADPQFDYGAIVLPEDRAFGGTLGWFGHALAPPDWLEGQLVNLSGYPADKPEGSQWYHGRRVLDADERLFYYNIDTAGGQSGAPVWLEVGGQRYVVATHTSGADTGNAAVRLTEQAVANIGAWSPA